MKEKEKDKKFRVIKDSEDGKVHIVLSQKTTFINQFNNFISELF